MFGTFDRAFNVYYPKTNLYGPDAVVGVCDRCGVRTPRLWSVTWGYHCDDHVCMACIVRPDVPLPTRLAAARFAVAQERTEAYPCRQYAPRRSVRSRRRLLRRRYEVGYLGRRFGPGGYVSSYRAALTG